MIRLLVVVTALFLVGNQAEAAPKKKYHFELAAVTAKPEVKPDVAKAATPRVELQVKKAFEQHPQLVAKLDGAPSKDTPDVYRKFLVKKGLAGAYLSLVYTPMWVEEMSAGRGWIALALVVFASWRPWRLLLGAYLFGGVSILQLYVQGAGGIGIPSEVLSMLPYLATVLVLTAIAAGPWRGRLDAPACLGKPFRPAT